MKNYFCYFPCSHAELAWGLHVSAAGYTRVLPHKAYPLATHPQDHTLNWSPGRVLTSFQLVMLSAGRGFFESKELPRQSIGSGQCFLLFPGVWHRYKPDPTTGWTEHWFELKGNMLEHYLAILELRPTAAVLQPKNTELMGTLFQNFHKLCNQQTRGYRPVIASLASTILAEARAQTWEQAPLNDNLVRRACNLFNKAGDPPKSIHQVAQQLHVSYPTLRRHFMEEIGINPKQYLEQIRQARAIQLLSSSNLNIKEIASRLHYYSAFHFSQIFKKQHGLSPAHWRRQHLAQYHIPIRPS